MQCKEYMPMIIDKQKNQQMNPSLYNPMIIKCKFCSVSHREAYNCICKICNKKGHYAKCCFTEENEIVNTVYQKFPQSEESENSHDNFIIGAIYIK